MHLKNCVNCSILHKYKIKKIQSILCFLFLAAFANAQDSYGILKNYKEFEVPFINLYKKPNYLNGNLNKKDFAVI